MDPESGSSSQGSAQGGLQVRVLPGVLATPFPTLDVIATRVQIWSRGLRFLQMISVCVCVRERERERSRKIERGYGESVPVNKLSLIRSMLDDVAFYFSQIWFGRRWTEILFNTNEWCALTESKLIFSSFYSSLVRCLQVVLISRSRVSRELV